MISPTLGKISLKEAVKLIATKIENKDDANWHLIIGTDSQNKYDTKIVTVIALHEVGHGGIYFYEIKHVSKIKDIRVKLYTETQTSLEIIDKLFEEFHNINFDYTRTNLALTLHVDAGFNGPSSQVIPGIVGYVRSLGFDVEVKPESVAACCIADRISK